ncbi:hypothetical protein OAK87_01375 [bacterium]|nr:hypothetical protein [bacterium]
MSHNLNLNEDCYIVGTVVSSEVTQARLASNDLGRQPVYSIEIKPEEGVTYSLGLLYGQATGQECLNADELHKQFERSQTLVFESLNKPCVSGVDSTTGEFTSGQEVRVSCRLEYKQTLSNKDNGFYATPRLILRFVDAELTVPVVPQPEVDWDTVYAAYDF